MEHAPTEVILTLVDLTKFYGELEVLSAINIDVKQGEFLTILGPSGSGKTTLLRLVAGLVTPTTGKILFAGADLAHVPINRRPFNTLFQDYALFPHMSVKKNIAYGLMVTGVPKAEIKSRVKEVIDLVELTDFENRYPNQLSGGQRQRVALARAIVNRPSIVLLDEPLSALDAVLRRQMQNFLKDIQRQSGITFIFVTHDQDEAISLSDRICVMNEGALVQIGTPTDIYYHPVSEFVASFFGDINYIPSVVTKANAGSVQVKTAFGLLAVDVAEGHGFTADDRAFLCIRPENLTTNSSDTDASTILSIPVKVANTEFKGAVTIVDMVTQTGDNLELSMKLGSAPNRALLAEGSALVVHANAADCAIVPLQDRGNRNG